MESRKKRILFIDKHKDIRWLLGETFKNIEACLAFSSSIKEGKAYLEQEEFDLIVCGYYLEDGIGLELLRVLRNRQKSTPFILFTSVEELLPELQSENFYFIKKPELGILLNYSQKLLFQSKQLTD